MSTVPWLSVVVCTYQGELFLREALESVAGQIADDIELIAIDDGSTDGTLAILQEFAGKLPLQILPVEHTGNWIVNTNRAMAQARGEFVCFLHQDDRWEPKRVEVLRGLCRQYPQCGMFVHSAYYINADGRRVGRWTLPFGNKNGPVTAGEFLERLMVQNLLAIPAPIFRRELAQHVGPMREDLWFLADWEYWARLAAACEPCLAADKLASFRVHKLSQTATRSHDADDLRHQYHEVIDSIAAYLPELDARRLKCIRRAAYINCELSITLALISHRRFSNIGALARAALCLSPAVWLRFWRDSRIWQRVAGRLRA
jgi:glycosyltransferase involved in cell wall biosynthesis